MRRELRAEAEQVESLVPQAMRALYRQDPTDPLIDFSVPQLRLLRLLGTAPRTASGLGEELGLSVSAITQMANRLASLGLISRTDDTNDRRIKHVTLTPKGIQLLAERRSRRVDQAQEILARMSPEKRKQLIEVLQEVVSAGGTHESTQPHFLVAELEQRLPPAS
ncbi:MAG TPA: MarR family transcriptional regulator [Fimbriimonadaceae bacterium]|nr:MarR family transcriptional regulator [Fimbriimonadaceae bacterium]